MGNIIPSNNNDGSNFNPTKLPGCRIWLDGTDLSGAYSTDYQGDIQVASDFVPTSISGCATWFDSSDTSTLYSTSAGPVSAVSAPTEISGCALWLDGSDDSTKYMSYAGPVTTISSPLDISGCQGWWDASDISSMFQDSSQTIPVLTNGDPVAVLRDKSGSSIHAIQSTLTSSRPTYTANLANNKSGLFFDGGDFLLANRPASSTHTILAVLYPTVTLMNAASPIAINQLACFHPQGGEISWFSSDTGNYLTGSYIFDFHPQIVGWTNNNSNVTGYKNSYVAFAGASTTNVSTTSGLQLGRRGDGYAYFTGYICEVVYYNKVLTTSERASVEQYLAQKWRIEQIHGPSLTGPVVAETSPLNINGCSLWLDASDTDSLFKTNVGPLDPVSDPTEINGCQFWLDASDSTSMFEDTGGTTPAVVGSPVGLWRDKSGNSRHVQQSTGSKKPIRSTSVFSSGAVHFDGIDDILSNQTPSEWQWATGGSMTWIFVGRRGDTPAVSSDYRYWFGNGEPLYQSNINSFGIFVEDQNPHNGRLQFVISQGAAHNKQNVTFDTNSSPDATIWLHTVAYEASTPSVSMRGQGSDRTITTVNTSVATSGVSPNFGLSVGADSHNSYSGSRFGDIRLAEVCAFNRRLTDNEIYRIEKYLANKWNISDVNGASVAGDTIGAWKDKSGHNRHAIQTVAASRPTKTGSQNTLPVVNFDGINDTLVTPLQDSDTQTIFWIAKTTGPSDYSLLLSYNGSTGNRAISVGNGGIWKWYGPNVNSTQSASSYAVMSAVVSGSNKIDLYQTGSFAGTANPTDQLGFSPNNLSIASTGTYPYKGEIAEIIVYNRVLSNYDRMAIEKYLDNKWIGSNIHSQNLSNKIGYLADKSGNNNYAMQILENNRPSHASSIQNNLSAISFSNASSTFFTTNLSGSLANTSQSYTVFLVCKRTASHSGEVLLGQRTVGCYSVAIYYNTPSLNQTNVQLYVSGPERAFPTETGIPSSIQMVCVSKSGSSAYSGWQGGLSAFLNNTISATSASQLMSTIGSSCSGQNAITGYIYEIILYDSVLSRQQRARVEKYLSNKWGLADVHVATDSGGNIGYWADKSGNNRNAIQDIKDYRPSRLGTVNNLSAITFDGTNDYFSLGDLSAVYPNFGEVFLVFEPNNATTYELYQSVNNYPIYRYADSTSAFGAFTSTRATPGQIAGPTTGVHVTSMRANSSNMTVRLDGNVWHTQNGLGYNGGWQHYIGFSDQGSGGVGGVVMNGKIVEVISYNRDIGAADRARVEQYLAKKWGISNSLHGKTNLTNDRIGYIPNKGSLNTAFSQINHHNRPRLGTLNGKTALDFTRSSANAYLQTPQQSVSSTAWSFFVVYRTNSINTTVYTYGVQDGLRLISRYPNNTVTYGGTNTVFYGRPLPINTTVVESLVKSAGGTGVNQTKLYRYGVDCVGTSSSGAGTEANFTSGGWFVLNGYNSPYTGQGYNTSVIGEFIAYDRALSNDERVLIEKYLHDKWNIDNDTNRVSKPTDISGCSLWLDADDIDTLFKDTNAATPVLVDGDSIAYWADKVGGQDVIQATGSARPTYRINIQNGKPMIYFDGGDDLLSQVNRPYSAPCTLFVVCRIDSHSGDISGIFTHGNNTGGLSGPGFCYIGSTAAGACLVFLDGVGAGTSSSSNAASSMLGLPRVITGVYNQSNTSNSLIYVNGNLEENFTGGGVSVSTTTNRVQIGARTGGGQSSRRMIGYVAECIRYDRVLTDVERASVENYLSEKWGIGSYSSPNSIGSSIIRHKIKVSNKDAQNWIDRVFANGGSVGQQTAEAVDKFCREIESAGLRKKFYRLNLFCGNDLQACLTPLYLGPDSDRFYGFRTESNTGFFQNNYDEKNGLIAGPGSSTGGNGIYLLTGVSLSDMGLSDTGHMAFYQTQFNIDTNPYNAGNRPIIGAGNTWISLQGSNNVLSYYGGFSAIESPYFGGLYVLTRNSSSDMKSYEAGALLGAQTASISIPEQTSTIGIFTGTTGSVASGSNYYFGYLKGYSVGNSMTEQEVAQYNSIMETFQRSLGRGIPPRASAQFANVTNDETKSWIDAVYANGGTVSSATAIAVNNFANSIESSGLRSKFYRLNLFCGDNLAACLVPLYRGQGKLGIRYGNTKETNILNTAGSNDFDYSESNGLLGNTQEIISNNYISRRYLRTGFVAGSITALNNNFHSAVYTKALTFGGYPIGAYDTASTGFTVQVGVRGYNVGAFANSLLNFLNTSTATLYPSNKGLYIGNYSNNLLTAYEGRAELFGQRDITGTPLTLAGTSDMGVFGEHRLNNGIALFNYIDRLQAYSMGSSLSSTDIQTYYDIMQTFQLALSRANVDPTLGSQFDSITNLDTRDWLTRVYKNGGTVSVATATAVQNFCNSIDSAGIRDRFYRLNLFCGDNLEASTVPLYRGDSRTGPQRGFLYDVANNIISSDYNESGILSGIKGNGSNKYLETGLGTDFTNNSSLSFGAFITSPTETAFSTYLGVAQNNNADNTILYYRDGFTRGLDGTTSYPNAPTNSILTGHHIYSRTASNSYFHSWNGTSGATSSAASSARGRDGFIIHALNNDGTIANYGNGRISMYHIGLGLSTQQAASFSSIVEAFNTEMGRSRPSSQFASVTNEDAKIWIDNVYSNGGTVSTATASAVNALCNSIDSNNLRSKFYRMNLFCGDDLASCLVPLYRGTDRTLVYGNPLKDTNNSFLSSDFNESSGLIGNGSTKWLDTGLPQNFSNYRHFGFVMNKLPSSAFRGIMGAKANTAADLVGDTRIQTDGNTTTVSYWTGSDSGQLSVGISIPIAEKTLVVGVSDSDNNNKLYADLLASNNRPSYSTSNTTSIGVFAQKIGQTNSGTSNTDARLSLYTIGTNLSSSEISILTSIIDSFNDALNRGKPSNTFASVTNSEVKRWIDAAYTNGGTVSTSTADAVNVFANTIDSIGIRSKIYRLNLMCGNNLSAALVPLYRSPNPNSNVLSGNYYDINSGSLSYNDSNPSLSLKGIGNGGTSSRLDTGLKTTMLPSLQTAHFAVGAQWSSGGSQQDIGWNMPGVFKLGVGLFGGPDFSVCHSTDSINIPSFRNTYPTRAIASRTNSGIIIKVKGTNNNYTLAPETISGTITSSFTIFGFGIDTTEISSNSAGNISFYSVGSSLTQTEVDNFDNALRIFLESIGRLNPT